MASRWVLVRQEPAQKRKKREPDVQRLLEADLAAQVAKSDQPGDVRLDQLGAIRMNEPVEGRVVIFEDANGRETGRSSSGVTNVEKSCDESKRKRGLFNDVVFAKATEPFKPSDRAGGNDVSPLFIR